MSALKNITLFVADSLFFGGFYLLMMAILHRPPVTMTAAVMFGLYVVVAWYLRLYNLEIYLNRILYVSRIFLMNVIVFILATVDALAHRSIRLALFSDDTVVVGQMLAEAYPRVCILDRRSAGHLL